MARIDNLPQNYLKKRIGQLQTQLQQLKTVQYAGSQNLQLVRVASTDAYDFTVNITYNTVTTWEVTFTPADQTFDNTSYIWHTFFDIASETGSGDFLDYAETLLPDNNIQKFRIYHMGLTPSMTLALNIKMVFYTLGKGTFSVEQIT